MLLRQANTYDIPQIITIRSSVIENKLLNDDTFNVSTITSYLKEEGCGWVQIIDDSIVGFSIIDLLNQNFWALFVDPQYQRIGIGSALHDVSLKWYFTKTKEMLWLDTEQNTFAEKFYKSKGWMEEGITKAKELRMNMFYDNFRQKYRLFNNCS